MTVRVYLPLDRSDLARLAAGTLTGPRPGHTVTDALAAEWDGTDQEDLEYAVSLLAGAESVDGGRRRVAVLEVEDAAVSPREGTAVEVAGELPLARVSALLVDAEEWSGDPDEDLAWFATQEIDSLLA